MSAVLGQWLTQVILNVMIWILALGFIAMAIWMLIPDSIDEESDSIAKWQHLGYLVQPLFCFSWQKSAIKPKLQRLLWLHNSIVYSW
jgi:putative Ca2+/H+ antiporter (TMEM165/GDT1 family)